MTSNQIPFWGSIKPGGPSPRTPFKGLKQATTSSTYILCGAKDCYIPKASNGALCMLFVYICLSLSLNVLQAFHVVLFMCVCIFWDCGLKDVNCRSTAPNSTRVERRLLRVGCSLAFRCALKHDVAVVCVLSWVSDASSSN